MNEIRLCLVIKLECLKIKCAHRKHEHIYCRFWLQYLLTMKWAAFWGRWAENMSNVTNCCKINSLFVQFVVFEWKSIEMQFHRLETSWTFQQWLWQLATIENIIWFLCTIWITQITSRLQTSRENYMFISNANKWLHVYIVRLMNTNAKSIEFMHLSECVTIDNWSIYRFRNIGVNMAIIHRFIFWSVKFCENFHNVSMKLSRKCWFSVFLPNLEYILRYLCGFNA